MTTSEFLTAVNYALRGTDDDTPTIASDESNYWIAELNRVKDGLYRNAGVLWDETYLVTPPNESGTVATAGTTTLTGTNTFFTDYRVGDTLVVDGETVRTIDAITSDTVLTVSVAFDNTVTANTFTRSTIIATGVEAYSLNRAFIAPANRAYVSTTASTKVYVDFITARQDDGILRRVFTSGVNPKKLNYTTTIASTESIVGGTLLVPGYFMPVDVDDSVGTGVIPLPDPYWGVMATASLIAGNDITYEDKEANLNAQANSLYKQMLRNNRRGTYDNPKKNATNVYGIHGTEVR
jgi:hypothetical protein